MTKPLASELGSESQAEYIWVQVLDLALPYKYVALEESAWVDEKCRKRGTGMKYFHGENDVAMEVRIQFASVKLFNLDSE